MKKEKRITGSVFAKILAYFLLAISTVVGLAAAGGVLLILNSDGYNYQSEQNCVQAVAREMMVDYAWGAMREIRGAYHAAGVEGLEAYDWEKNYTVEFYDGETLLWSNYGGEETPYSFRYNYSQWLEEPVIRGDASDKAEDFKEPEAPENPETPATPETDSNSEQVAPEGEGAIKLEDTVDKEIGTGNEAVAAESQVGVDAALNVEKDDETVNTDTNSAGTVRVEVTEPEMQTVLKDFTVRLYVDPDFPVDDAYMAVYNRAVLLCDGRYVYPVVVGICVLLALICFVFLMCGAGHRNGKEGITPGLLTAIHFDILAVGFGMVAFFGCIVLVELIRFNYVTDVLVQVALAALLAGAQVVWCTVFCADFATRLKLGGWWKHTLIAAVLRLLIRALRFCKNALMTLIKGIPLIWNVTIIFFIFCLFEFIGLCIWGRSTELIVVWFMEKTILLPVVMYVALVCKKLQAGSKALADGDLNFKIDTSKMVLDFKDHGENLNQIGEGISKAVAERMKSEHLKTELITNVSHDLKTPLTSIINYADLLQHEVQKDENTKTAEYAEVLHRQSKRLKKLLEDLVEASKATTGALEVNLAQCEIGVLLSQAVGEYEQRFVEKQLSLIVRQPEEPVRILADGRHLWRVFDNLLNNIYKYAQENTRVYLSVENRENQVEIIFRNMSKYALDISGEELEERFVRGDKSRHMEGNGLGLSIAKSLVELQNGRMEIVTDGDLFKVTLCFQKI